MGIVSNIDINSFTVIYSLIVYVCMFVCHGMRLEARGKPCQLYLSITLVLGNQTYVITLEGSPLSSEPSCWSLHQLLKVKYIEVKFTTICLKHAIL